MADALADITATPWTEREARAPRGRFLQPADDSGGQVDVTPAMALRVLRILQSDFAEHGSTEG